MDQLGVTADNKGMPDILHGEDVEPFGELLRRLRLAAGMTQESLAQAAGVSVDAVGTLERGARHTPRAETARLLADALGLDGEGRRRFLAVSAPHPRQAAPIHPPQEVVGLGPLSWSPPPLTPLVGREELVGMVSGLLSAGPQRLITLTGPGGVGKTRVALALVAKVHTVCWVDLAALSDPADVPYAVTEAVGLVPERDTSPMKALVQWMPTSRVLLVLDNCEHLLDAVADLVARLLAGPHGVTVLATSRERLGVPGEQIVIVPPLALPAPGRVDPDAAAVRLFVERAAQAAPGFALNDQLINQVINICRALDGLPLAIELAAARVGTLTVDDLAGHLDARLELLSAPRRLNPRHHTLRSMVDWSYDLLSETERLLFARLHVFAADFDLAAAQAIAADERTPATQIPHLVALLADRSMLTRPGHAGVGRYRMLETLRAYAASRLSANELTRTRRAHARYLVELAERAFEGIAGPDEAAWAALIAAWLDDVRAAFVWARDAGEADVAVPLAAALTRFGQRRTDRVRDDHGQACLADARHAGERAGDLSRRYLAVSPAVVEDDSRARANRSHGTGDAR
jgi:predicted ATPase/DNA-binding XRE family transcriptional regulator